MHNIEKIDYTTFVAATMDLRKEGFYKEERIQKVASPATSASSGADSPPHKVESPPPRVNGTKIPLANEI